MNENHTNYSATPFDAINWARDAKNRITVIREPRAVSKLSARYLSLVYLWKEPEIGLIVDAREFSYH